MSACGRYLLMLQYCCNLVGKEFWIVRTRDGQDMGNFGPANSGHPRGFYATCINSNHWFGWSSYIIWNWRTGDVAHLRGVNRVAGDAMISPDGRTLYVLEQDVDGEIWMLSLDRTTPETR